MKNDDIDSRSPCELHMGQGLGNAGSTIVGLSISLSCKTEQPQNKCKNFFPRKKEKFEEFNVRIVFNLPTMKALQYKVFSMFEP